MGYSRKIRLPLILIPAYFTLINFTKRDLFKPNSIIRIIGSVFIGAMIAVSIYLGGLYLLQTLESHNKLSGFRPSMILNLLFFSLFLMLFFTSFFAAINQIYTSKDLEMLHKSPISLSSFINGQLLKTYIMTTWMSLIFIIPIFAFFTEFYEVSYLTLIYSIILCLIFFTLTTTSAYILASIYPIIIPGKHVKTLGKILLAGLAIIITKSIILISSSTVNLTLNDTSALDGIAPFLNRFSNPILPSSWLSTIISGWLIKSNQSMTLYICLLVGSSILSYLLAYIAIVVLYEKSLILNNSSSEILITSSRNREEKLRKYFPAINYLWRAFTFKDFRIFSRNSIQIGQMIMLLFLMASYLYIVNYQVGFINNLELKNKIWWINVLTICNSCTEAFITLAIGTRIIYPQWTIEGKSIWLMQSAPIDLKNAFRAKLYTWFIPTSLLLSTLFTITLIALKASIPILILKFIFTIVTTYSLVGLGLGLGAYFSNVQQENISDTTASFGSMVFMLVGFVVIFTNLILLSFIFSNSTFSLLGFDSTQSFKISSANITIGIVFLILNWGIGKIALTIGQKKLENMLY
jgi:ABC-2 type transport system permease protein